MLPDRASNVEMWDFDKLVTILLRQFKRLLAERGVDLTDAEMQQIGVETANHTSEDEKIPAICAALADVVAESETVLKQWNLTFAQSLATDMNAMPGWTTTADFLEIANDKVNAEVRISAGSALMLALGDTSNVPLLLQAIEYDLKVFRQLDVDAVIARRALLFVSGVEGDALDWLAQVKAYFLISD